jgi:Carbohydrate-binding module 48 (Isoamylase N-terminal domain)
VAGKWYLEQLVAVPIKGFFLLQGYEVLGFVREKGAIVYREWAPAASSAQLIGDFNGWSGSWMERNEFGVWSVRLPDGRHAPAARAQGRGGHAVSPTVLSLALAVDGHGE